MLLPPSSTAWCWLRYSFAEDPAWGTRVLGVWGRGRSGGMEDHTRDGAPHVAHRPAQTEGQGGRSTWTTGWIKGAQAVVLVTCASSISLCQSDYNPIMSGWGGGGGGGAACVLLYPMSEECTCFPHEIWGLHVCIYTQEFRGMHVCVYTPIMSGGCLYVVVPPIMSVSCSYKLVLGINGIYGLRSSC